MKCSKYPGTSCVHSGRDKTQWSKKHQQMTWHPKSPKKSSNAASDSGLWWCSTFLQDTCVWQLLMFLTLLLMKRSQILDNPQKSVVICRLGLMIFSWIYSLQTAIWAMTFCGFLSLQRVLMIITWTTFKSAYFPVIVSAELDWQICGSYYLKSSRNISIIWDTRLLNFLSYKL